MYNSLTSFLSEEMKDRCIVVIQKKNYNENCHLMVRFFFIFLTEDEKESYENEELCHICHKEFYIDNNKKMRKVRDHCHYTGKYRGAAYSKCNLNYKIVKEIPVLFHNGSVYDYHFTIKYLAREFKVHFECLGENTDKYISFTVPFTKVRV